MKPIKIPLAGRATGARTYLATWLGTLILGAVTCAVPPAMAAPPALVFENEYVIERAQAQIAGAGAKAQRAQLVKFSSAGANISAVGSARRKVAYLPQNNKCADLVKKDRTISTCSPNFIRTLSTLPNDPKMSQLWGLKNAGTGADVRAETAWDIFRGSSSEVIAVVDSGIDYSHPDLAANIWTNPGEVAGNGRDDDGDGYVDDVHGFNAITGTGNMMDDNSHGTHVSGTIAAVGNNGQGVVGVNWTAKLLGVKVCDSQGSCGSYEMIRGIDYVVNLKNRGVNVGVINMSLGGYYFSQAEYNAIARAGAAGILVVAAAGNESNNNDWYPSYPASFALDNVISVAAIDSNGNLADFSNYGASTVDLAAPGVSIISTVPNGGYASYSGTSMATPHVTGAVGLLRAYSPSLTAAQLKQRILSTARQVSTLNGAVLTGGILNLTAMLQGSGGSTPPPDSNPPDDGTPPDDNTPPDDPIPPDPGTTSYNLTVWPGASIVPGAGLILQFDKRNGDENSYAVLTAAIDGNVCSRIVGVGVPSVTTLVGGRFPKAKQAHSVSFVVSNEEGGITDSAALSVVPNKRSRSRDNVRSLCTSLMKSLYYLAFY